MRKILSAAVVVGLALACDVNRDLPVSPDGSGHAIYVTVSDPNAAKGSIVTVTGQVATGSSIPTLGSYTARLELGPDLEFLEALSVGAAAQAIRANGDTVIAAGASVSGFADGRLFAVRARVRAAGFASALHIQLVEATATGFVGAPKANRASSISVGKWGDVTIDGSVGAADAQAILTAVVDIGLPSGYLKANGDANCDGSVAATDAQVVLSYAVGLSVSQYCVAQPMAQPLTVSTYSGTASKPIAVLSDASKVKVATWTSSGFSGDPFSQTAFIDEGRGLEFRVTYGASDIPSRIYDVKTKESITITSRDDRVDYLFFDGSGAFTAGVALVVQGTKLSLAEITSLPSFSGQVSAASNTVSFSAVAKVDGGLGSLVDAQAGLVTYHNATLTSSTGTATSAFKRRLTQIGLIAIAAADPTAVGASATALKPGLIAGGIVAIAVPHYPDRHDEAADAFELALGKYMQDGISAKLSPGDVLADVILDLKNNSKLEPADYGKTTSKTGGSSDVLPAIADATTFQATSGAPAAASTAVDGYAVDNSDNMYTLTGSVGATGSLSMTGTSSGASSVSANGVVHAAPGATLTISGTITGTTFVGGYSGTPGSGSLTGTTSSLGTCQTQFSSGGQGTFAQTFNMGAASGSVTFSYEAYTIPDAFRVVNAGTTILNTGSISGGGSKTFALSSSIVFVTVSAPLSGTAWDFSLSCPTASSTSKIIAVNAGNNQTAAPGASVPVAPAVKVTDGNGTALSGETVTFAVASGGGSITGASAVTNSTGIATLGSWMLGSTAGTNTLTATLSGATGSPVTFTATAGSTTCQTRSLTVGQAIAVSGSSEQGCNTIQVAEATPTGNAHYYVAISNVGSTYSTTGAAFQLVGSDGSTTAPSNREGRRTPDASRPRGRLIQPLSLEEVADQKHERILEQNLRYLREHRTELATRRKGASLAAISTTPTAGSSVSINIPNVNNSNICTSPIAMTGRIVYVGSKSIIVEDNDNVGAGALDTMYTRIGGEFDNTMYPILTANYGNPLAIDATTDNNGRIVMVFSRKFNDNFSGLAGFVVTCDFATSTSTSNTQTNTGEYFYARAPMSTSGTISTADSPAYWNWTMRGTIIHEVKHLVSFAERISRNASAYEESWLEETTARMSEELYERGNYSLAQKSNIGYGSSTSQVGPYCGVRACGTPAKPRGIIRVFEELGPKWYASPELYSPIGRIDANDFSFYATGWSLVRWAIDQSSTTESAFLQALTQETALSGVANLQARTGRTFADMIQEWSLAMVVDDYPGITLSGTPATRMSQPTWNFRNVFSGYKTDFSSASFNAWPLNPYARTIGAFTVDVANVRPGTSAIIELTGAASTKQKLELKGAGGTGGAPSDLRISVIRVP